MSAILYFVGGLGITLLQAELWNATAYGPDLRLVAMAFLLTRLARPGLMLRITGFCLGCATGSLEPVGLWCAATGLCAMFVLRLRPVLFVQNPVVQVFAAVLTVVVFEGMRSLFGLVGLEPVAPRGLATACSLVTTIALAPIVHPLLTTLSRLLPGKGLPSMPSDELQESPRMGAP